MQDSTATLENGVVLSLQNYTWNHHVTQQFHSWALMPEKQKQSHTKICTHILMADSFVIDKNWPQLRGPWPGD